MDSVRPTVAIPSAPSPARATKKMSTTANSDSSIVSSTIGTASRKRARPMGPSVKSCFEPLTASRIVFRIDMGRVNYTTHDARRTGGNFDIEDRPDRGDLRRHGAGDRFL